MILLSRLAVDRTEQGSGLGKHLLRDAILRSVAASGIGRPRRRRSLSRASAGPVLALGGFWSQTVDRRGGLDGAPVLISEQATAVQFAPSTTALPGNGYVASWTGSDPANRSDWDAKARVLRFDGTPVTAELRLNEVTAGRQSRRRSRRCATASSPPGPTTRSGRTRPSPASSAGPSPPLARLAHRTSCSTTARPASSLGPLLTTLRSGQVVAAWEDRDPVRDGSGWAVVGRTYAADLGAPATEQVFNTTTVGNQKKPRVAATGDGGWLAVWEDSSGTDDPVFLGIRGRVLPGAGEPAGGDRQLNTLTADNQQQPAVAVVRDRAVVVWTDESRALADKSRTRVVIRTYNTARAR